MQLGAMDCGIACLAMLLGRSYEDVAQAAQKVDSTALRTGLTPQEAIKVARLLGRKLRIHVGEYDIDEVTGMLYVQLNAHDQHIVIVFNGTIYNPADGMLYLPEVYMASKHEKVGKFLIV